MKDIFLLLSVLGINNSGSIACMFNNVTQRLYFLYVLCISVYMYLSGCVILRHRYHASDRLSIIVIPSADL